MPAHKTHFAVAQQLNKVLKLDSDLFTLGNVLPDLTVEHNHQKSHFQNGIKWTINGTANPDLFLETYKIDSTIMLGYLAHLLTDQFWNNFLYNTYYLYDANKNVYGLIIKGQKTNLNIEKIKETKKNELHLFDKYLLVNKKINKFNSDQCVKKVKDLNDLHFDKNYLKNYIKDANEEIDKYKNNIFSIFYHPDYQLSNQKELNKVFNDCCNYILEYFKKNNIDIKKIKESNL